MACICPTAVTATLRRIVQAELEKARAILAKTGLFNAAVGDSVGTVGADIDAAIGDIPDPLALDSAGIASYLTCPLTPLALGLQSAGDVAALDQTVLAKKLKGLSKGEVDQARANFDVSMESSANAKLIEIARSYTKDMLRLDFTPSTFEQALLITATVQQLCPDDEYLEGPYQDFAIISSQISFDASTGVPTGLDTNAAAIVQKLLRAEEKLEALRASLA